MIVGKKTVIRPLRTGDENLLHQWWNDPDVMSHAGFCYGTLQSKTAVEEYVKAQLEEAALFPTQKRFIIELKETNQAIGEMNYCGYDQRRQVSEFGIKLLPEARGKGYGKDALSHFLEFMFNHLNLNKIELTSQADNLIAHKLYRKLGFQPIGIIRQGGYNSKTGRLTDVLYMDLLRSEWRSHPIRKEVSN